MKKHKNRMIICKILSVLANFGPVLAMLVASLLDGGIGTKEKFTISIGVVCMLICASICLINKCVFRSKIWLFIIIVWAILDNILTYILIIAICQVLDEIIFDPLFKKEKNLYIINREIERHE